MGAGALIAPLAQAGIGAATSGKGGGTVAPQGGISPEQAALAQYGYGQDLLAAASGTNQGFPGQSTMMTQASGGARNKFAQSEAGASDVNQQLQIAQQTKLQELAQQQEQQSGFGAGSSGSFGSSGGSAGNTGGSTGTDTGTTSTG
ncbi:MAG TPA: hypothetical protein VHT52_01620 [Stellaceae bacterium]|jgi:hypothetical protein|nr:hypothetical protein [Stellaceae bacterium]